MFGNLLGLVGLGGPAYDAKVLHKDARAMIEMVGGQHGAASLRAIALQARTQIDEVHRRGLGDTQYYGRGIDELTDLNRAARARRDNVAWSGITFAIIYIKAEILGDLGLPAKHAVEGFIEQWIGGEDAPDDDSVDGTGDEGSEDA